MRKNSINGSTVYTYNPEYNRNSYKKNKKAKEKGSSMKKKIVSILLVSIDNFDFATTFSGVLTTMSNVGPGISKVGPVMNFHPFSALSKLVFCFDMLIGRLEIFPYLLLLSPELWRRRF